MKRILFVPYDLNHAGGGTCVAAWALQALAERYEVSVLSWQPAELRRTNRNFGTELSQDSVRLLTVNPTLVRALSWIPVPLAHLRQHLLYRRARELVATGRFDVVIGAMNEIDVGAPAIQYIHFPLAYWPRPDADLHWYHAASLVRAYRWFGSLLSGFDEARVARNLTLSNSDWTGRRFAERYGTRARTVYPPVPGGFPEVPFDQRDRAFIVVGRIAREKRIEDIIEILAKVRARGHATTLTVAGHADEPEYLKRLTRAAAPHLSWVRFCVDAPRARMVELITRHRYGIHAMEDEHFGIAPAELQRGGCITFVPDTGGPPEIVAGDERVIFASIDDAVDKIDRVLSDPLLESALQRDVARRGAAFSEERFMREIVEVVESFDADPARCGAASNQAADAADVSAGASPHI